MHAWLAGMQLPYALVQARPRQGFEACFASSQHLLFLWQPPRCCLLMIPSAEHADDAKELLTKIGHETSLRYAIHLITASSLIAAKRKAAEVDIEDVSRAYTLFIDVKRSVQYMLDYQEEYMFNEIPNGLQNGGSHGEQMEQ